MGPGSALCVYTVSLKQRPFSVQTQVFASVSFDFILMSEFDINLRLS